MSVKTGNRAAFAVLFLLPVLLCLAVVRSPSAQGSPMLEEVILITQSGRHTIRAEIADTPAKRELGLMFRRSLPEDQGMLFLFGPERVIEMWMKNTYISLDMIFIASNGTVVSIAKDTEPFSESIISSGSPASAVLEVNAGVARRLSLKVGDKVVHPRFKG